MVKTTKDFVKVPQNMKSRVVAVSGQFVFDKPEEVQNLLKGVFPS